LLFDQSASTFQRAEAGAGGGGKSQDVSPPPGDAATRPMLLQDRRHAPHHHMRRELHHYSDPPPPPPPSPHTHTTAHTDDDDNPTQHRGGVHATSRAAFEACAWDTNRVALGGALHLGGRKRVEHGLARELIDLGRQADGAAHGRDKEELYKCANWCACRVAALNLPRGNSQRRIRRDGRRQRGEDPALDALGRSFMLTFASLRGHVRVRLSIT
jgi:hypothetical protein